jgi:molybdate/tungstate transport system substrate-binding protein
MALALKRTGLASKISSTRGVSSLVLVVILVVVVVVAAIAGILYINSQKKSPPSPLILYCADAYVAEASALESGFTNTTGIPMAPPKSGGSLLLANEIAQGNPVSVFISVSKSAVSSLYLKNEFSGWAIAFAADQMTIAYSNATLKNPAAVSVIDSFQKAQASNLTQDWANFYSNLTSGQIKVGISDPNSDPAGFRAWMVLEAAGYAYENGNLSFFVDRMLSSHENVTSSSAAELVAPLETGQIQFLFIYKSSAISQNLKFLQLPSAVNLGNPKYSAYYSRFTYSISSGVQKGAPITLFVTVPKDSTDPSDSITFVIFVVKNAPTLLTKFGITSISPAVLYNDSNVPSQIQGLLSQGSLVSGGSL